MSDFKRFNPAVLLLLLPTFFFGQAPQAASTPVAAAEKYSQEAFVIEQTSGKLFFESDGTFTREDFARVRIQSDAGVQTYEVLTFPYASSESTLQIDSVRVLKGDGTVVDTPLENIQDMPSEITREAPFYSDVREKHVAVKGLGTGDVLEFKSHLINTKPLGPGKFWFAYNFTDAVISLDEQLEIDVPSKSEIKIASAKVKPDISETAKYRTYRWHYSNLHQKPKEDEQLATYNQARGRLPEPNVQISNFQTWDEVGRWYYDLQRDRVKPTPEIQAEAALLTKDAPDDTAKLQAIYKYVSTEFHYIGIAFGVGRYQPHSASEVLSNQYGDCKDKHTLLASLLGAAGFKVYPALISTSHEINPEVPSTSQFDHVITVVQRGNDLLWLDSTPEVAPLGYLISPLWGKQALVMYGDRPAALTMTPAVPPVKATSSFRIKATLADTGVLEGEIERSQSDDDIEIALRTLFRKTPFPQWKDLIQQISYVSGFAGDVSEVTASSPEAIDAPFKFSYKYSRKDYPDWANRKIDPPLPPMGLPSPPDDDKKLSAPLWLGAPGEHTYISEVELPKGYRPELPPVVELKSEFADYHARSEDKDGKLVTTRILTIKLDQVPIDKYDEYKKFKKAIDNDHDRQISLFSSTESFDVILQREISNLPGSENTAAARSYDEAMAAVQNRNLTDAINFAKQAIEADGHFVRARILLAQLYTGSRQTDLALQTLREGWKADPQQPVTYQSLVRALIVAQKHEEAVTVLQEVIKAYPEDAGSFYALSDQLLILKRFGEAAEVTESALRLHPEQPDRFYFQLGRAYLLDSKDDQSLAAFKKAIEINPNRWSLNDIGYEMAEANRLLPQALEYAQKAVREAEERSASIKLDDLKQEDLGPTLTLASFWDTLGWVYFRMQDYDKAAKYLNAAWSLTLGGVEADHLGQVYEQQHKKQAAIHMYQMALAAGGAQMQPVSDASETKARLKRLSGTDSFPTNVNDFNDMRTFKLPRLTEGSASAEFFLLFSPQDKAPGFSVDDVKFISGSDKLKSAVKALKTTNFKVRFPNNGPSHILRRGIVGCYQYTGCSIVLKTPYLVQSVN